MTVEPMTPEEIADLKRILTTWETDTADHRLRLIATVEAMDAEIARLRKALQSCAYAIDDAACVASGNENWRALCDAESDARKVLGSQDIDR